MGTYDTSDIPEHRRNNYLKILKEFRLMDDSFMTKVFEDNIPCTEVVLRTILNRSDLIVQSVQTQYTIKNLQGRSVRLDVHALDRNGVKYDIEIQRASEHAGQKRARHNSSMMDANALQPGEDVEALPETYVIFITEKDVLGMNEPLYEINRKINDTPVLFGDGSHIIYVNGAYQDESPLGCLMKDFFCKDPAEMKCKVLAERVDYLKNSKEGVGKMCKLMDDLWLNGKEEGKEEGRKEGMKEGREEGMKEGREEGMKEGREEGMKEGRKEGMKEIALSMIKKRLPFELISECTGLSVTEVEELSNPKTA